MTAENLNGEEWKWVPGYEGLYMASDKGRVRSHMFKFRKRETPYILKQKIDTNGYHKVKLYKKGKKLDFSVHRLVLLTFIGPPEEGQYACHNDGNPSNNRLENLRWGTIKENMADKIKHGTVTRLNGEENPNSLQFPLTK